VCVCVHDKGVLYLGTTKRLYRVSTHRCHRFHNEL